MNESTTPPTEQQLRAFKESMTRVMIEGTARMEGCNQEARRLLYQLGIRRFGQPNAATIVAVAAIRATDDLEAVCLRTLDQDIRSWDDLLQGS